MGFRFSAFPVAVVAGALILAGCAGEYGPKEGAGGLLGAAAGGVAGAQFGKGNGRLAATSAGALFGAMVGASAGRSMDRADALYAERYSYPSHSQQVPRPYAAPSYSYARSGYSAPAYSAPAMNGCQFVGGGPANEPTFACQAPNGAWFITR